MMEGSVPQFVQDLKVRAGGRLFGDEHDMRTLQLLRSVGTSSGALIVDYRVLDDA